MTDTTANDGERRRGGGKAPGAYRTISEVAEEIDVPAHVLRFWEGKFPQVKPLKRAGGRRYYRPEDVVLLRRIRSLLYDEGYTIKGVQKLLREGGVKAVAERVEAGTAGTAAQDPDLLDALAARLDRDGDDLDDASDGDEGGGDDDAGHDDIDLDDVDDPDDIGDDGLIAADDAPSPAEPAASPTSIVAQAAPPVVAVPVAGTTGLADLSAARIRTLLAEDERRQGLMREALAHLERARALLHGDDEADAALGLVDGDVAGIDESFAEDVLVIELSGEGAGASGIAGGAQPADGHDQVQAADEAAAETIGDDTMSPDADGERGQDGAA
ncbi:MerR family transcriptional regulator [Tistrella bauzanensis]